jgi:hypothetical protein
VVIKALNKTLVSKENKREKTLPSNLGPEMRVSSPLLVLVLVKELNKTLVRYKKREKKPTF